MQTVKGFMCGVSPWTVSMTKMRGDLGRMAIEDPRMPGQGRRERL